MKKYLINISLVGSMLIAVGCGGGGSAPTEEPEPEPTPIEKDTTPPTFVSVNHSNIKENYTKAMTVKAVDDKTTVRYYVVGGDDKDLFYIYKYSGILVFKLSPDYENPKDKDTDNIYQVRIKAKDKSGNASYQDINITVTDIAKESNSGDSDGDYIPDNIEALLDMNSTNADQDDNNITDGLQSSGAIGDKFFDMQWHLRDYEARYTNESGVKTQGDENITDLNVTGIYHKYMGYNEGNPIIVQVVDTGVDADHEDLVNNIDLSRSYDEDELGGNPSGYGTHGTMVAGIIASRAFNGKGVRGIAPFAHIAGSNWLEHQDISNLDTVWTNDVNISVTNNSWGSYQSSDTFFEDFMEEGVTNGREGKGRIYTFAAGNDRGDYGHGNANLEYMLSNRFPIVVAALKNTNEYAVYSTPGSNIWVSGYSGDFYQTTPTVGTTTIMGRSNNSGNINEQTTWDDDTNENYTFAMNGTSSASPTVAGSIALVLEACPSLTWRDVKYLIAKHAFKVDDTNSNWVTNHAGFHHSIDYGFGRINAQGMIAECTNGYTNLPDETNTKVQVSFDEVVPDGGSKDFNITVDDNITAEWVEVTIDNDHPKAKEYKIELTSPYNTKTVLMTSGTETSGSWMDGGWRFSTAAMLGESTKGTWTVTMYDTDDNGDKGTVDNIIIKIYGH